MSTLVINQLEFYAASEQGSRWNMEHLEEAGIHSGDSTCFIPAKT